MSDTDNAEYGARGAVPVKAHMDLTSPVGQSDRPVDARAAFLAQERAVQNQLPSAVADPTGTILLTELQEMRGQLNLIGTSVLMGIWLMGMVVGYAGYLYLKNNQEA